MTRFSLADRLWLAWKVLRGVLVMWRADAESFEVTLRFVDADRLRLQEALDRRGGTDRRR